MVILSTIGVSSPKNLRYIVQSLFIFYYKTKEEFIFSIGNAKVHLKPALQL